MDEKVVWITGATSGIGEALALAYAARGASLILSARREEKLRTVKEKCTGAPRVWVQPMDIAEYDSIPEIARSVLAETGGVDILINNAGITQRGLVAETRMEVDKRIMEVNFFGTVALTKALLPHMLERGSGRVVVISSLVGKFSTPLRSAYAASKHALHGFFDALRAETHDSGIRTTIICPGFVRTNVSRNALTATGERQGTMDERTAKGMAPEKLARRAIRAIERNRREVYIGGTETLLVYIKRFFPGLQARLVRKLKVT